ncbi:MAG: WG repeat-containing protein [candidate division WOR-3 bacterium]
MKNLKKASIFSGLSKILFFWFLLSNALFLFAQNLPEPPEFIPYRKGDKWGFCDRNKKIVIECKYDGALPFSEGLAAVKLNGKWGYIDKTGKEVIAPEFDLVRNFSEGFAAVEQNGIWGYINKKGKIIIPMKYVGTWSFSEGLAVVQKNGELYDKYGYIDKNGKEVIPVKYERASNFSNGIARVKLNGKEFYIDKTGKEVDSNILGDINSRYGNLFTLVSYTKYVSEFRLKFNIITLYNVAKLEEINNFIDSNKDFFYNLGIIGINSKGDILNLHNLVNEKLKILGYIIETDEKFDVEIYVALDILMKIRKLDIENFNSVNELKIELNKISKKYELLDLSTDDGVFGVETLERIEELVKIMEKENKD